jgi:hypothetical protein
MMRGIDRSLTCMTIAYSICSTAYKLGQFVLRNAQCFRKGMESGYMEINTLVGAALCNRKILIYFIFYARLAAPQRGPCKCTTYFRNDPL